MTKPIAIDIVVGGRKYESDLRKVAKSIDGIGDAANDTAKDLTGMNKAAKTSKVGIDQLGGAVQLLGGVVGVLAIQELSTQFLTIADNAATLKARVELASEGLGDAAENMEALIGLSAGAGQDLGQVVTLFEKMTLAAEGLGATNGQLLQVTDTVSKLTSGVSQNNATAALQQLGQALGNDIILAEEFNSIQENTPLLLSTVAGALGMTSTELKKLQRAGELTSDMFFNGLLLAQEEADRRFSKLPRTIEKASEGFDTRLTVAIATLNTELGLTDGAVGVIDDMADLIKDITPLLGEFSTEIEAMGIGLVTLAGSTAAVALLKGLAVVLGTLAGPVGLLAVAAAGVVYFITKMEEMPSSVDEARKELKKLNDEIERLSVLQAANDADDPEGANFFNDVIGAKKRELAALNEQLRTLEEEAASPGNVDKPSSVPAKAPPVKPPVVPTKKPAAGAEKPPRFQANPYDDTGLREYGQSRRDSLLLDEEAAARETERYLLLAAEYRAATEEMEKDGERAAASLKEAWDSVGEGLSSSLARSFVTGENMVDDFLKNIAEKIIQAQIQENIVGPLIGAVSGSAAGGEGGFLGGLVSSIFGGGFATGGQMPANRVALVGENGPELISTGNRGAYVTPNNGGMGAVQVQITNESGTQVQARSATAQQTPEGLVVGIVLGDINDNGPISRSIQNNLAVGART